MTSVWFDVVHKTTRMLWCLGDHPLQNMSWLLHWLYIERTGYVLFRALVSLGHFLTWARSWVRPPSCTFASLLAVHTASKLLSTDLTDSPHIKARSVMAVFAWLLVAFLFSEVSTIQRRQIVNAWGSIVLWLQCTSCQCFTANELTARLSKTRNSQLPYIHK